MCQNFDAQRRSTLTLDRHKDNYLWKPDSERNNVIGNDCVKLSSSHDAKLKKLKT